MNKFLKKHKYVHSPKVESMDKHEHYPEIPAEMFEEIPSCETPKTNFPIKSMLKIKIKVH